VTGTGPWERTTLRFWLEVLLWLLVGALVGIVARWGVKAAFGQTPGRTYWPVAVDSLAIGHNAHTHVAATGKVTLVRHEADGDTHIKIVGLKGFIVAECVPELPCRVPKVGERVTVRGIYRQDYEHKWYEVHPVEFLSP
jgi:hypothetical protein